MAFNFQVSSRCYSTSYFRYTNSSGSTAYGSVGYFYRVTVCGSNVTCTYNCTCMSVSGGTSFC